MKHKNKSKILSLILSLLLFMQVAPISVFANETEIGETNVDLSVNNSEQEEIPNIVCEVTENRTEYTKEFLLEDGSYYSLTTTYPMHSLHNGEWENTSEMLNEVAEAYTIDEVKDTIQLASYDIATLQKDVVSESVMMVSEEDSINSIPVDEEVSSEDFTVANEKLEIISLDGTNSFEPEGYPEITDMYELSADTPLAEEGILQVIFNGFDSYIDNNSIIRSAKLSFSRFFDDSIECGYLSSANVAFLESVRTSEITNKIESLEVIDEFEIVEAGNYSVDLTDVCNKWDLNFIENNGIVIRITTENRTPGEYFSLYNFLFEFRYQPINERDLDFTYHTIDMGNAGTVYINNYTNSIWLENTLFDFDSAVLPISLSRFADGTNLKTSNYAGYGLKWNIESSISVEFENEEEPFDSFKAAWSSFNGEKVIFVPRTNNQFEGDYQIWRRLGSENFQDNRSINLYILNSDVENRVVDYTNMFVRHGDTTYRFNELGHVVSITRPGRNNIDANVEIEYEIDSRGNLTEKISSLTTENGTRYDFGYQTYSRKTYISQISRDNLILLNFSISSNSGVYTNTVTFSNGETISYNFNQLGRLIKVVNSNNECWQFDYATYVNSNNETITLNRVSEYTKSSIDAEGNVTEDYFVSFSIPNGYYREITKNENGTISNEIIQYNRNHNIITHKDYNGNYVCAEYNDNGIIRSYAFSDEESEEMLNNSSFELSNEGSITNWILGENSVLEVVDSSYNDDSHGAKELRFSSDSVSTMTANQTVFGSFVKDNTYVVGAWVKASETISDEDRKIGLEVKNPNGDSIAFAEFDNSLDGEWQYRLLAFKPETSCSSVDVVLTAQNQIGDIRFDEITLFEATDSQAELNNIVTSSSVNVNYNEDGTISSEVLTDGVYSMGQAYVYDNNGKIIESKDINGLTEYYKYSALGKWIGTSKDSNGEFEDATQLTYDSYGVLQTVTKTINAVTTGNNKTIQTIYGTDSGRISSVYHGGVEYSFEYNPNGTISTIDVSPDGSSNDVALVEYGYTGTSNIGYIIYKNGYELDYTYDPNGNIQLVECLEIDNETNTSSLIKSYEYTYNNRDLATSYDSETGYTVVYSNGGYSYNTTIEGEDELLELYTKQLNENGESFESFRQAYHTGENNNGYDTITSSESTNYTDSSTGNTINSSSVLVSKNASDNKLSTMNYSKTSVTDYFNRIINKETSLVYETGKGKTYNVVSETDYEYQLLDVGVTSGLISEYTTTIYGDKANPIAGMSQYTSYSRKYEYDHRGNVKYVYIQSGSTVTPKEYYEYDEANQLVTAIDFYNKEVVRYSYDSSGNLASKFYYDYANLQFDHDNRNIISLGATKSEETLSHSLSATEYTYPDKDGQYVTKTIEYDEMGNPKTYVGVNIDNEKVTGNLEWTGNLLSSFENDKMRIEYQYDLNGYRSTKTVYDKSTDLNGNYTETVTYKLTYLWENGVLKNVIHNGGDSEELSLNLIYDQEGSPVGYITSMGLPYYFLKDVNENVLGLIHADGTKMCSISYDAWGTPHYIYYGDNLLEKLVSKATAVFNPVTYHGYIYDYETGMYCSQGRCYSPAWGRYLNPEDPTALLEYSENVLDANLYLFCNNNPINNADPYAMWSRDYVEVGWNAKGFNVAMNDLFASRSFCTIFANQFLEEYGEWDAMNGYTYLGMDSLRIASDLFAHYIGKNASAAINKTNAIWGEGWLSNAKDLDTITIKNNDKNAWKYEKIWYAAPEIKAYAWSEGVFITL